MDEIPVAKVREFEKGLLEYMSGVGKPIRDELEKKRDIKAVEKQLEEAIRGFKSTFKVK
jgi:F0F1-type ATP synthase alpha subunit